MLLAPLLALLGPTTTAAPRVEPPQAPGVPAPRTSLAERRWTTDDGLPQNSVSGLGVDADGYLWVATFAGLARFDGVEFEVFDVGLREDLDTSRFFTVHCASDGSVWIGTLDHGILRHRDGAFTTYPHPTPVTGIVEDAAGTVWTSSRYGVHRLVGERFERVTEDGAGLCATRDGSVWYSTSAGLVRHDADGPHPVGSDRGLPEAVFACLFEDRDGTLWLAARGGPLYRSRTPELATFEAPPGLPTGVRRMTQASDGSLWMTGGEGLCRLDPATGEQTRGPGDQEGVLASDVHGNVWFGERGPGLSCRYVTPLRSEGEALGVSATDTWAVTLDRGGNLLVGTSFGLYEFDGERHRQQDFGHHVSTLLVEPDATWIGLAPRVLRRAPDGSLEEFRLDVPNQGQSRCLFRDSRGTLWLGTDRTLLRLEPEGFRDAGLGVGSVHCLLETPEGVLWAGGSAGLHVVAGAPPRTLDDRAGLSPGRVQALHRDGAGRLWVGTYGGGLNLVEGDRVHRFAGLPDEHLAHLAEDGLGRLWVHSNRGPFALSVAQLLRVAGGSEEPVDAIEFTSAEGAVEASGGHQPPGCRTPDGRLWLATVDGVTVVDPSRLPVDEPPPNPQVEPLELGPERSLIARFHVPGTASPERLRVEYRMGDGDTPWTRAGRERSVRFPRLGPGEHRFEVRARNGLGPWSPAVGSSVRVRPRFHETLWFPLLLVLLTAAGVTAVARVQVRRGREREEQLLALVRQREAAERSLSASRHTLRRLSAELMHAQESERTRLAAELHDDITQRLAALSIQVEVCLARHGDALGSGRPQLEETVRLAQTLATDVQRLSRRLHPVGLRTLGLEDAVRTECEAFARRTGLDVSTELQLAGREVPERVAITAFRILQESLHNVEKHSGTGAVEVGLSTHGGELVLYVQDHGRGFVVDEESPTGLGLVTMRERATSVGAELTLRSTPGVGTTVELHARLEEETA